MIPKTIQTIAFVLGYLPEREHKSLLLKLPFTLDIGPRGLAFMVPECAKQVSKGGKQAMVVPGCDVYKPRQ